MYVWLCRKNTAKAKFCVTVVFCSIMTFIILCYAIEDHRHSKSKKYIPKFRLNRSMRDTGPTTELYNSGVKNRTIHIMSSSESETTTCRPSSKPFRTAVTHNTISPTRQSVINSTTVHEVIPTFKQLHQPGFEVALPGLCPENGSLVKVVIVIISSPRNTKFRSGLRKTVQYFQVARNSNIPIAFMLGQSRDPIITQSVREESLLYKDIIINRNFESYKNLSLKTLSLLEWYQTYCSKASYILKVDDDMFINANNLYKFVTKRMDSSNVIYGQLAYNIRIARNRIHMYYVPWRAYHGEYWPLFVHGSVYLLSSDVPATLYRAALNHTFMTVEDAFFTGILAAQEGVRRIHVPQFWSLDSPSKIRNGMLREAVAYHRDIPEPRDETDGK